MKYKKDLIDLSNLWFATASFILFIGLYALNFNLVTAFIIPLICSMVLEIFLYYKPFKKRLTGIAIFIRITTTLIINLIFFYILNS